MWFPFLADTNKSQRKDFATGEANATAHAKRQQLKSRGRAAKEPKGRAERQGAALFALAVRFALAVPRPSRRHCRCPVAGPVDALSQAPSMPCRRPRRCLAAAPEFSRSLLPVFTPYFTSPSFIRYSAICTALRAAPLRIWSPVSQSVLLLSSARSLRMRPT